MIYLPVLKTENMATSPDKNADSKNLSLSQNEIDESRIENENAEAEDGEITLELPDVADIPGQENIVPPKMGMFVDTTISSDGEEGTAVFPDEDEDA